MSNIFVLAKLSGRHSGWAAVRDLNIYCPQKSSTWQGRSVNEEKGTRRTVLAKKRGKSANGSRKGSQKKVT